jgi:hypothetical protein
MRYAPYNRLFHGKWQLLAKAKRGEIIGSDQGEVIFLEHAFLKAMPEEDFEKFTTRDMRVVTIGEPINYLEDLSSDPLRVGFAKQSFGPPEKTECHSVRICTWIMPLRDGSYKIRAGYSKKANLWLVRAASVAYSPVLLEEGLMLQVGFITPEGQSPPGREE